MGRRGKLELEVKVSRRERRNGIRNGEGKEGKAKWRSEKVRKDKVLEEKWELGTRRE